MNEFQELEYKYKADNVGLKEFVDLMNDLGYKKRLDISSWDVYYTNGDNDNFIRYRESHDTPELTIKRKTTNENNWHRVEVDLPLDSSRVKRSIVEKFVKLEGYNENFKIYKSCFIFWQDYVNYVYYIVYDEQLREQGRFLEVEVNKDSIHKLALESTRHQEIDVLLLTPKAVLKQAEKNLECLGITPQNRLKKSLFEMFRR